MSEILPLKDFIVTTLTSICDAVEEVRKEKKYVAFQHAATPDHAKTTLIEFDLAVTISDANAFKAEANAEIKTPSIISVISASLKGGVSTNEEKTKTEQNRIKFNIPVDFRLDEEKYSKIQENINRPMSYSPGHKDRI